MGAGQDANGSFDITGLRLYVSVAINIVPGRPEPAPAGPHCKANSSCPHETRHPALERRPPRGVHWRAAMLIRLATPTDGGAMAEIYRPAVVDSVVSFELDPPDAAEMSRRITTVLEFTPWLVAEDDRRVLGYAYATRHRERPAYRWSVDVSVYVHRDAQRRGVGRALYTSLFAVLVAQGFRNAYAGITLPNPPSVGLHLSMGFTPVGRYRGVGYKNGAWHDTGWFERALAPRIMNPSPPRALPECTDEPALGAALRAGAQPTEGDAVAQPRFSGHGSTD